VGATGNGPEEGARLLLRKKWNFSPEMACFVEFSAVFFENLGDIIVPL